MYLLGEELVFPPPEEASPEGLVAIGGDVSPERLLLAYTLGIFPWPSGSLPLLWFSPDPRAILTPKVFHIPRSLARAARRTRLEFRADTAFADVITACAATTRPCQDGTWITDELRAGYERLHALGYAHSIEAYDGNRLVGGLYGVSLGGVFFGESMFTRESDASKLAFLTLMAHLDQWGIHLVDCQVMTEHLARFGSVEWPRAQFLTELRGIVTRPTRMGPWELELGARDALQHFQGGGD